jgi:hypothetical protein
MARPQSPQRRRRLENEIAELRELAFSRPNDSPFPEADYLEIERESVVRARVLLDCAMLEEASALIIMDHVLADCPKWHEIEYFGRIKRYRILYDDILGRVPARHKMRVVGKFIRVPKKISKAAERMLALRDLFAHVRTLDYTRKQALQYKGQSILSKLGFQSYLKDSTDVVAFLIEKSSVL